MKDKKKQNDNKNNNDNEDTKTLTQLRRLTEGSRSDNEINNSDDKWNQCSLLKSVNILYFSYVDTADDIISNSHCNINKLKKNSHQR